LAANYPQLPPDIQQGLQQAREAGARAAIKYENYLLETLTAGGLHPTKSQRCRDSLDIMFGRKQVELQQQKPTRHLFPDLPQRAFYEREEFDRIHDLEAHTDASGATASSGTRKRSSSTWPAIASSGSGSSWRRANSG
jgi:hypothetical protein